MAVKVKNLRAVYDANGGVAVPVGTEGEAIDHTLHSEPAVSFECEFTYNNVTTTLWMPLADLEIVGGYPALLTWMFGGVALTKVEWGVVAEDFEPIVGVESFTRQRILKLTFASGFIVTLEVDRATGGFVFGVD